MDVGSLSQGMSMRLLAAEVEDGAFGSFVESRRKPKILN